MKRKRSSKSSSATRYNKGKLRWNLLFFDYIEDIIRVLEFGACKYSSIFVPKLEQILARWNVKVVEDLNGLEQRDFVTVVMKQGCLIYIQSVKSRGRSIKKSTELRIVKNFLNSIDRENESDLRILDIDRRNVINTILNLTESQRQSLTKESSGLVNFVERKAPLCTQTITMRLDSFEVCFAVSAITGLDSSMMIFQCLEKLLGISLDPDELIISGSNNWKKGLNREELLESMQRHIVALFKGEEIDPESGLPHEAHIGCNNMFYSYHKRHNSFVKERQNPFKKKNK